MPQSALHIVRSVWERFTSTGPGLDASGSETEQFLARLVRHLPGMVYRCSYDRAWTMEYVSPGSRPLTGFDPHDLVGNRVVSYGSLIHPDDSERVWKTVEEAVVGARPFQVAYRIRRVDGAERSVWAQGAPVVGPDGRAAAIEGFVTDVTDREDLASRLAAQESRYEALVEQALTGVYIVSGDRFRYVNPRFAEIFGYSVEEILAMPSAAELVHPDDRTLVTRHVHARMAGEVDGVRYEVRGRRRDGSERILQAHGRTVDFEGSRAIMGVLVDVTDSTNAQRRYHDAQKMEALGRLAAGVAHDFNNVLTVIMTTARLAAMQQSHGATLAEDLDEIIEAAKRGAAMSRQLMAFGRGRAGAVTDVALSEAVAGMLPMLRRLVPESVEIDVTTDPDVPTVQMDPSHAEELVMNLVLNARDALPEGGRIGIEIGALPHGWSGSTPGYSPLPHAVLVVRDTGVGILESIRPRIFEPYFTTKGKAGNGLGLGNVWRIVTDLGGGVEVESEVGRGSTFRIFLPSYQPEV